MRLIISTTMPPQLQGSIHCFLLSCHSSSWSILDLVPEFEYKLCHKCLYLSLCSSFHCRLITCTALNVTIIELKNNPSENEIGENNGKIIMDRVAAYASNVCDNLQICFLLIRMLNMILNSLLPSNYSNFM